MQDSKEYLHGDRQKIINNTRLIYFNTVIFQKYYFFTREDFVSSFLLNTQGAIGLFSASIRAILQVDIWHIHH